MSKGRFNLLQLVFLLAHRHYLHWRSNLVTLETNHHQHFSLVASPRRILNRSSVKLDLCPRLRDAQMVLIAELKKTRTRIRDCRAIR